MNYSKASGMANYRLAAIMLTLSIVSTTSFASGFSGFRKLSSVPPGNSSTASQVSPMPGPVSQGDDKGLKLGPVSAENYGKEKPKGAKVDVNDKNDKDVAKAPPPASVKKSDDKDGKSDNMTKSQLKNEGSCEGLPNWCRDNKDILACIETSQNGPKEVFLVVQNRGKGNLRININMSSTMDNALPVLDIPKHQSRRINISSSVRKSTKVTLNAGSGECVLHLRQPVSVENLLQQLSLYSKQVTPLYGVYFSFLVALLLGGSWACCRLSKRRRQTGVPYQELEMGLPESASGVHVNTAEDWDQDWDDNWDNDGAVTSPNGHHKGSISANGLTSRSSRKEGWDDDWED